MFASKSHNFSTTRHCSLDRERDRPMHPQLSSPRAHCRKAFSFHNLSNPPTLAAPVASPFAPPVTRPFADRHAEMRHCGLNVYPRTHCSVGRRFRQAGSRPERNVNRLGCTATLDWRFEYCTRTERRAIARTEATDPETDTKQLLALTVIADRAEDFRAVLGARWRTLATVRRPFFGPPPTAGKPPPPCRLCVHAPAALVPHWCSGCRLQRSLLARGPARGPLARALPLAHGSPSSRLHRDQHDTFH